MSRRPIGAGPRHRRRHVRCITKIAYDDLVGVAHDAECMLQLVAPIGEFVPAGAPLFKVHGQPTELDEDAVLAGVALGLERTLDQDVAYGLRMLVDIAERSLADSPFLDPTTAVQAVDRLHDCLRQLAGRVFPTGCIATTPANYDWSCRRWTGTHTCTSHSTRSGSQALARPKCHADCGPRSKTSSRSHRRIADRPSNTRWTCCHRRRPPR